MFLVWKTLFDASALVLRDHPRQDAARKTRTPRDPESSPDATADQLWEEWLEDDDWRSSKS